MNQGKPAIASRIQMMVITFLTSPYVGFITKM
jgi:hypothetical protein